MKKLFIILFISNAFSLSTSAQSRCGEFIVSLFHLKQTMTSSRTFPKTEVFRRNNDIGMQQLGNITVKKWFEMHSSEKSKTQSLIGLTEKGEIFHIIHFGPQRTIARLLSGTTSFKNIIHTSSGHVLGVDSIGAIHIYLPKKWSNNSTWSNIKHTGKLILATSLAFMAASKGIGADTFPIIFKTSIERLDFTFLDAAIFTTSTLSSGYLSLLRYEHNNTYPHGFHKTHLTSLNNLKSLNQELNLLAKHMNDKEFLPPELKSLPPRQPEETTEAIR